MKPNQVNAAESTIVDMDAARAAADQETAALRAGLAAAVDNAEVAVAAATASEVTAAVEKVKLEAELEAGRELSAAQERLQQAVEKARLEARQEAEVEAARELSAAHERQQQEVERAKVEAQLGAAHELSMAQERLRQELVAEREAALAEALDAERGTGRERVALVAREVEDLRAQLLKVCVCVLCVCGCLCVCARAASILPAQRYVYTRHVGFFVVRLLMCAFITACECQFPETEIDAMTIECFPRPPPTHPTPRLPRPPLFFAVQGRPPC